MYDNQQLQRMISDLASEIEGLRRDYDRLRSQENKKVIPASNQSLTIFTKVDPFITVHSQSGTDGDDAYDAAQSIDFSTAVPASATKAWVQITVSGLDTLGAVVKRGFRYTPDGWSDYIENYRSQVTDADVDEKYWMMLPLSTNLTGTMSVVKINNSIGDTWSYTFEVFGYE